MPDKTSLKFQYCKIATVRSHYIIIQWGCNIPLENQSGENVEDSRQGPPLLGATPAPAKKQIWSSTNILDGRYIGKQFLPETVTIDFVLNVADKFLKVSDSRVKNYIKKWMSKRHLWKRRKRDSAKLIKLKAIPNCLFFMYLCIDFKFNKDIRSLNLPQDFLPNLL